MFTQIIDDRAARTHRRPAGARVAAAVLSMTVAAMFLGLAFAQPAQHPAAGTWEGAIEIPGTPLPVIVTLTQDGEAWTGAIDIPAQGVAAAPLDAIAIEGKSASFRIAQVPGEPTFTGEVDGDTLAGTFSQGGQEIPFTLTRTGAAAAGGAADADAPDTDGSGEVAQGAPSAETYVDPAERFSFPVPGGWQVSEHDGFVRVTGPEGDVNFDVVVSPEPAEDAITAAWQLVAPELELESIQTIEPPSDPGVERTVVVNYDAGDPNLVVQAVAQVVNGETYIMLVHAQLASLQRRSAQFQIIASGFEIGGMEQTDLSSLKPLAFEAVRDELEEFIAYLMPAVGVPGATMAVVQGGEVVHLAGYGVKELGSDDLVHATTQMMIGSVGKTLTSMLTATLVDDGIIEWDTPVVEVLPRFAVADEELTETLTIRNLLCACTGVPRRDFELAFNYDELDAEGIVESLREFEFFTDFGEAFQYSNQLVATAGYAAAAAAGAPYGELRDGYRAALEERVLEPIGMSDTTLDFDAVTARGDYAIPHQVLLQSGDYDPIDLGMEELVSPVEPAGAHWSTAVDLARYMLTELNSGLSPSGERVVSEANLEVTWEPQVPVSSTESYGLGWFVGEVDGLPIIYHGGNTLGFSSDLLLVPSIDLGVAVVTNAQGANLFTSAAAYRLIELLYQQPAETVTQVEFAIEQTEQAIADTQDQVLDRVPLVDALELFGAYSNPALGQVSLTIVDGQLLLDAGEWAIEVRPYLDRNGEPDDYITIGAPFSGLPLRFEEVDDGPAQLVIGEGLISYTFTRLR